MTDYLYIKNNRYYVVLSYKDKESGKFKKKWISTGISADENKEKAENLREQYVAEYLKEHPDEKRKRPKPQIKPKTEDEIISELFEGEEDEDEEDDFDEDLSENEISSQSPNNWFYPDMNQVTPNNPELFMNMLQMFMPMFQNMAAIMGNQGVPFDYKQIKINGNPVNSMILFTDFIPYWAEFHKSQVSENSFEHDIDYCKLHIIPYFEAKGTRLCDIDTEVLQEFVDFEKKFGNLKTGEELSPKSLKNLKSLLSSIMNYANMKGLITTNYAVHIKLPKQAAKKVSYYNEEQLEKLFECIKNEEIFPIVYLTAIFGLRRSEVLGLKWDSVDFAHKTVEIKHTVVRFRKVIEKDTCKSASSQRVYPMTEKIEEILLKQKENEERYRRMYGIYYTENAYIFKWPYGKMYNPDYISKAFKKLLKKHNLPIIRFHDLRHSCASLLIARGYNIEDIKEWLGHSDIQMTSNIYGHFEMKRKCAIAKNIDF